MEQMKDIDSNYDNHVDQEIITCLNLENPKSFFLFAGAGAGKTRSLVTALNAFRERDGQTLRLFGQRVAIITYTNAACDEIKRRLDFDPLFAVSTIHSFVWDLIRNFQLDIKNWIARNLVVQIEELELQQSKGRSGSKAASDRQKSIETKTKRLNNLDRISKFTYNPNGENHGRDSLNHSEVINIAADFIQNISLMQKILIRQFPIILIDESQDTKKELIEAFFEVQRKHSNEFCLGLFGDTMQRIYTDGKADLGMNLPEDWSKPVKKLNHRCPKRVVTLINKIRSESDDQTQEPVKEEEGFVRLFVVPSEADKSTIEKWVAFRMAEITSDPLWRGDESEYQSLILEHHMAAIRMGVSDMFEPLYRLESLKAGLIDGTLPGIRFFNQLIIPLIRAKTDKFTIASILRSNSPLLTKQNLISSNQDQLLQIKIAKDAVNKLLSLWDAGKEPSGIDVLHCVAETKLFDIPDSLYPIAFWNEDEQTVSGDINSDTEVRSGKFLEELDAWEQSLKAPISQFELYESYITGNARFMTHQGVKGLEFPRVMVIIDEKEARGSFFSYEKLFGVKDKTSTDLRNEKEGKETNIDKTRRLFYVTCSRAEKSLAVVAYTENPQMVKCFALEQQWFDEKEIEMA